MDTPISAALGSQMAREMAEQPHTIHALVTSWQGTPPDAAQKAASALGYVHHVLLSGCGSSLHAAMGTAHALSRIAGIGAIARPAHELIGFGPALWRASEALLLFGQSGETHDTLEALRLATQEGCPTLAVTAATSSTLYGSSRWALCTQAGSERAIPSTKGFVGQWLTGVLWAQMLAAAKQPAYAPRARQNKADPLGHHLAGLSDWVAARIDGRGPQQDVMTRAGRVLASARQAVFVGSSASFVAASEGALKLKESALVIAHATTPGELKHGPIAMLEHNDALVILLSPALPALLHQRLEAFVRRLILLGVQLVLVAEPTAWEALLFEVQGQACVVQVEGPADALVWPLVATVALQQLALAAARARGVDPDAPRRLVKSIQDHLPDCATEATKPAR